MMAPEYYIFTGRDGERVPRHVTHVIIAEALKFVPARAFFGHPNIKEVICHDEVEKIEQEAFHHCPSLRRIIMPGVKKVETWAFGISRALSYIECGKLERIGKYAFGGCESLSSIDLPSTKIVKRWAFQGCGNLINANFGKNLESIRALAFHDCPSLERIALPLKFGMTIDDSVFQYCDKLNRVDLVGGVHETVSALLLEEWKNDMNEEIESVNLILPNTSSGDFRYDDNGEKAREIRTWITSVLHKYIHYTEKHRSYLNVAAATLQSSLPNDVVLKNVLPFLELPSDTCAADDDDESDDIPLAALRLR